MADSALNGHRSIGTVRVRVDVPDPVVLARPGEVADCLVRVHNDGPGDAALSVRVHGLGVASSAPLVVPGLRLAAGESVELVLDLPVPESFGTGSHALAVEITTDRQGDRPVLAPLTLSIGSLEHVTTRIEPSMLRGGRRKRFRVEVYNRTTTPTTVELSGEGQDLRVRFDRRTVELRPGEHAQVRGKVRGPRRWVGDPVQHVLTVETQSNSIPRYATATYRQRALVPRRVRGGMLAFAVLLVWVAIAASVVLWVSRRGDDEKDADPAAAQLVDADGDGVPDPPAADGSSPGGGDGSTTGEGGAAGGAGGAAGAGAEGAPTATIVRGTVKAGSTGEDDGVLVTLTPVIPGADSEQQQATTAGGAPAASGGFGSARAIPAAVETSEAAPADGGGGKLWPARLGTYQAGGLTDMRTVSVSSQATSLDGSWQFSQVPLRQSYEVTFAKAGYGTESFIVTPPDDGEPVELEVELEPGDGELGGRVLGITQAAEVEITDGTLTFRSTTSTDADDFGRWDVDGMSTPGTYTVTISHAGYGTEVMQVKLGPGESRDDLVVQLSAGVGSISGMVTADGDAKGGVTLTATAGDTTLSTTSLTEGAKGTYLFPQLPLGSVFTVTASAEGFITQTRSVTVDGNVGNIDFALIRSTAAIIGQVLSSRDGTTTPLVSAAVSVVAGELEVRTSSAASPVAGAFSVTELPPGSYVVTASRYDHPAQTRLVSLTAGQVLDLGQIVLEFQPRPQLTPTGSLTIRTVDAFGQALNGATVQVIDVAGRLPAVTKSMGATESVVQFTSVPIGTYRVRVTKNDYRPGTIEPLSIGLGAVERQVTLLQYGTARGSVIDAVGGYVDPPPPLLDDRNNQVYATRMGVKVYIDPSLPIEIPPVSQVGPGAAAAYHDAAGRLVVRYTSGELLLDLIGADGIPDEPLTAVTEKVGNVKLGNYELLLYRLNGTVRVCIGVVAAAGDEWEIDPAMQMVTGSYVMRFSPLAGEVGTQCTGRGLVPDGFAVIPANADGDVAAFEIADNLDQRVVVDPIPVAPFPRLSGRVLVPGVDPGPPPTVEFGDFDDAAAAGLASTLDCGAGRTLVGTLAETATGATTFEFTRSAIAGLFAGVAYDPATGALPTCSLSTTTTVGDYIPVTVDVPLSVGLAAPYTDRVVNVALVDDPGIIVGTVQWKDDGATGAELVNHLVPGATIASDDEVVVAFTPSNDNDPDGPPDPTVLGADPAEVTLPVSQVSDAGGGWSFAVTGQRQVIDTERYTVSAENYQPSQLDIEATGAGWTPTAVAPAVIVDNGSTVDVFLEPEAGTLAGQLMITSIRGQVAVDEAELTATAPGDPAGAVVPLSGGQYTIDPAEAGTWQLDFGPDTATYPASNLYTATTRAFVGPNEDALAPVTQLLELGQVNVALRDQSDRPIVADDVHINLEQVDIGATTPAGPIDTTVDPDATTGDLAFGRLPVNTANPTSVDTRYRITGEFPGYDITQAEIYFTADFNHNGVVEPFESLSNLDYDPTTGFDLPVAAGTIISVRIVVPAFATISGSVLGVADPYASPETTVPLTAPELSIQVTRTDVDPDQDVTADIDVTYSPDGSFSMLVPTGTYTLTFLAPNYIRHITPEIDASQPGGVVEYDFDPSPPADIDPVVLRLQPGALNFTTLTELAPDVTFNGALVELWWGDVDPFGGITPTHTVTSTVDGSADFTGVYPGTYTVLATVRDGNGDDQNFPVIGTVTVARGAEGVGSTQAIKLLMPEVGGSIEGTAVGQNRFDRPVALPTGLQVTRTYDLGQLGGPDVLPNEADESVLEPTQSAKLQSLTETTPGVGATYDFTVLPAGTHQLTFTDSPADGAYDPLPSGERQQNVAVVGRDTEVVDIIYEANDVPVTVTVTRSTADPGDPDYFVEDATVALTESPSDTGMFDPGTPTHDPGSGVYDFGDVPPDLVPYVLSVSAPGYRVRANTQETIEPSGTALNISVELEPLTTISGVAMRQDTEAGPATIVPAAGWVRLFDVTANAYVADAGLQFNGGTGEFTFAVEGGAVYRVDVVDPVATPVYRVESAPVNGGGEAEPGESYTVGTVTALKYASATITVTTPSSGTTLDVSPTVDFTGAGTSTYTIPRLDPEQTYTITLNHPDYEPFAVFTNLDPDIGLAYSPGAVVMTPKPAVANVSVGPSGAHAGLTMDVTPAPADPLPTLVDGAGQVTGLTPGTQYTFSFTSTNFQSTSQTLTPTPNGTHAVNVTMTPKPAVANVTVGPTGAHAGLTLQVTPATTGLAVPTLVNGAGQVTGLASGTEYTFSFTSTNFQSTTRLLTPTPNGVHAVNVTMDPKPAQAVISIGGGAASVAGRDVTISPSTGVTKTGTGPFTFTGLQPGTSYTFTASAPGYIPLTSTPWVATPNGAHTDTLTPFLQGTISGTVTNGAGANVYVCVAPDANCNQNSDIRTKALTSTDTAYSFNGFDPGTYVVRVIRGGDNASSTFTVSSQGVSTPSTIDLTLPP